MYHFISPILFQKALFGTATSLSNYCLGLGGCVARAAGPLRHRLTPRAWAPPGRAVWCPATSQTFMPAPSKPSAPLSLKRSCLGSSGSCNKLYSHHDAMAAEATTQKALRLVAQGTRWTYSLLWQLCPHQG
jgi:hypothetical protein